MHSTEIQYFDFANLDYQLELHSDSSFLRILALSPDGRQDLVVLMMK
jgi:hypothetical protein